MDLYEQNVRARPRIMSEIPPIEKPQEVRTDSSRPAGLSWKDHPVVVAVIACVGTLTIVSQFIIPTWLQSKDNQIAIQKTQIESLESQIQKLKEQLVAEPKGLKEDVATLRTQLQMSEAENLKLRGELDSLDPDSVFAAGNVYPRGLRGVRIGDDVELIRKIYTADVEIKDNNPFWVSVSLKDDRQVFSLITYYRIDVTDVKRGNDKILHVLFQPRQTGKATFDFLKTALVAKYGDKIMTLEKDINGEKTVYVWRGVLGHILKLDEDGAYYIETSD